MESIKINRTKELKVKSKNNRRPLSIKKKRKRRKSHKKEKGLSMKDMSTQRKAIKLKKVKKYLHQLLHQREIKRTKVLINKEKIMKRLQRPTGINHLRCLTSMKRSLKIVITKAKPINNTSPKSLKRFMQANHLFSTTLLT